MPDPVIVPPTPIVTQGEPIQPEPPSDAHLAHAIQEAFDKKLPPAKGEQPPVIPPPSETPIAPATETPSEPPKAPEETVTAAPDRKLPSFLEEALKVEPSQEPSTPPPPTAAEEWPEELPDLKTEESKANWKKFRGEYNKLKEQLKNRPASSPVDEQARARMEQLEAANREMQTTLSRFGVEQNAEFQQNVIRPLTASWNEAAQIVKDAGRDPNDLARAMTLQGKTQFEALDELFEGMPESAKTEIHDAIRSYRHFEGIRQNALANAPKTYEQLHRKELERQYQVLNQQKQEMVSFFDEAVKTLRDEAKVEILRKTNDPEAAWWNDQADSIIDSSKKLYLENTDMKKMAIACVLAPMADAYRKLWMAERAQRTNAEKTLKERFGSEPSLSESGGNAGNLMPSQQMQEDLKRPFSEVFLREFHKQRASGH